MKEKMLLAVLAMIVIFVTGCCNEDEVEECLNNCYSFQMLCYSQVDACPKNCEKNREECYSDCIEDCFGDAYCVEECNRICDEEYQNCIDNCGYYSYCDNYNYTCEDNCPEENSWCGGGGSCSGGCYYY